MINTVVTTTPKRAVEAAPIYEITRFSLTLCLAYIQRHTPPLLPRRRFIAPVHLRQLARWVGQPNEQLRSIRQHRQLAAHCILLEQLGLLDRSGKRLTVAPFTQRWLARSAAQQDEQIAAQLASSTWEEAIRAWRVAEMIDLPYRHHLRQSFALYRKRAAANRQKQPAQLSTHEAEQWTLTFADTLDPLYLFDLLQLGEWQPDRPLVMTPFSIAQAAAGGYGMELIQWLLETVTAQSLSATQTTQLRTWVQRANSYRWALTPLLITEQPNQLAALLANRRLRLGVVEQLSPRVARVQQETLPKIERWLAKQGYPLAGPALMDAPERVGGQDCPAAESWLALKILTELSGFLQLPLTPPRGALVTVAEQLSTQELSELALIAAETVQAVRAAVYGRDAFFPAFDPTSETILTQLKNAIAAERCLLMQYQALGDREPRHRRVQPLRLEQRGELHYLTAYCFRAEMTLTFRVDRVVALVEES